ncbi:MAG: ABC transporter permease [Anaerolineales bacterium]|nr:ABC transporter permease [Anaerolineales bacterium]
MRNLENTLWIETRKALRSRLPLVTTAGFLIIPLVDVFFMVILRDPEFARSLGLISAKAQLVAGSADWPTYLNIIAQAIAIGGLFLYGLVAAWVFGREFADHTAVDLLAVPVPRAAILLAKFIVITVWCLTMTAIMYVVGIVLGSLLDLPLGSTETLMQGSLMIAACTLMVIALAFVTALVASVGRGYLLPLGFVFLVMVLSQVIGIAGWGDYFPWAVPALYANVAAGYPLAPVSFWIVALTGLAAMAGTYAWWRYADQT